MASRTLGLFAGLEGISNAGYAGEGNERRGCAETIVDWVNRFCKQKCFGGRTVGLVPPLAAINVTM